jgi:hypothetical protein
MGELEMDREAIDDMVCELMMEYGPDGHVDGHERITDFIETLLADSTSGCRETSPGVWQHQITHPDDDCLSFRCNCGWLVVTDHR